jgi:hypothetical protein
MLILRRRFRQPHHEIVGLRSIAISAELARPFDEGASLVDILMPRLFGL